MCRQFGEYAAIHAYHSHHRKACHRDEGRTSDRRYTLDRLPVVFHFLLDDGARIFRIERVFYPDGDILDAYGIDGRRIDDLGTEVTKFHGFDVTQLVDGVGRLDNARIGSHESIHVGPYFQHLGIKHSCQYGCRVVTAAPS